MKKLCFAIPTWNRAKKLEKCILSIANQILELGEQNNIGIFVSDNASTDDTPKVLSKLKKKFPFLEYTRLNKHVDTADSGEIAYRLAQGEYLWIFGDDDILLKDGLKAVWHILNTKNAHLIHAGNGFLTPHSYKIYEGSVLEFANKMGFNQFIGWATSIIIKKDILIQYMSLPQYPKYKESAYTHVLGILHVASNSPAVVLDFPICQPIEPQTSEDVKRWALNNIFWRTILTIKGFKILFDLGILKEKVNPMFFKYDRFYFWDRCIFYMINSHLTGCPFPDEGWDLILSISDMIDNEEMAEIIKNRVMESREQCETLKKINMQIKEIQNTLNEMLKEHSRKIFEWGGWWKEAQQGEQT
ncbi:glycosyltransferase family 2 protein [Thermodesulfobacterium sp. TA1]|uniref:glycosyltransferase family 2 protein n=1 Tax=Thermodesulfobacterium sp. TA1 TaxID=2234087 RepID=UPI0012326089|nr:glycosyltransferase family A protein [Thermodesulfobacterium sp. TA1]QER42866.1 glycosyltransferase family 2 protein [Thermodesulfobacterium sp. TA1]